MTQRISALSVILAARATERAPQAHAPQTTPALASLAFDDHTFSHAESHDTPHGPEKLWEKVCRKQAA